MATLTISHHIYLTDEQRYKIHNGEYLSLQGIARPVWFYKGSTSEPAQEIFCPPLILPIGIPYIFFQVYG